MPTICWNVGKPCLACKTRSQGFRKSCFHCPEARPDIVGRKLNISGRYLDIETRYPDGGIRYQDITERYPDNMGLKVRGPGGRLRTIQAKRQ
jgi:hypothetical protein